MIRDTLHALMQATLADEQKNHDWTYRAVRPMHVPPRWSAGERIVGDCSKGVQYLCRWANAPDPMGNNYSDFGNSATMCLHLRHLDKPSQLEVGDIVTFGIGGDEHAAMVYQKGNDPLLWSFGHQGAPNTYHLSQDQRVHQLLHNPIVSYVPTTQDLLRKRTGYWSWLAWSLGEGDWRPFGTFNKKVRPNVPKMIPLSWWRLRMKFILARKKGNKSTT